MGSGGIKMVNQNGMVVCPRCRTKNFGEDDYCEKCLFSFVKVYPQAYYARWLRVVKE